MIFVLKQLALQTIVFLIKIKSDQNYGGSLKIEQNGNDDYYYRKYLTFQFNRNKSPQQSFPVLVLSLSNNQSTNYRWIPKKLHFVFLYRKRGFCFFRFSTTCFCTLFWLYFFFLYVVPHLCFIHSCKSISFLYESFKHFSALAFECLFDR